VHYLPSWPWPAVVEGSGESLARVVPTDVGNEPRNWTLEVPTPGRGNGVADPMTDTDRDGLPDAWELVHGLDRLEPGDAAEDPDVDGATNLQEYLSGTDPWSATSVLRFETAGRSADGVELGFNAVAGRTYTVEFTTELLGGGWEQLMDVPAQGVGGPVIVPDAGGEAGLPRFYRLLTPASP
jgi:hypothetical protein